MFSSDEKYRKAKQRVKKSRQREKSRVFLLNKLGIKSAEALVTMWMKGKVKVTKMENKLCNSNGD